RRRAAQPILEHPRLDAGTMNIDLSHRRAIVTGAAQGIGRSIVEALARENVRVAAFDIDPEGLVRASEAGAAMTRTLDLADKEAVGRAVSDVACELGGIDILVNC